MIDFSFLSLTSLNCLWNYDDSTREGIFAERNSGIFEPPSDAARGRDGV